jgi:hypothetical protein
MGQQHINFGTAPAGTDGDTVRTALGKVEANTTELYSSVAANGAAIGANATALGVLQGFKNKLINGNFDRWQRGTSFSPAPNETRCCDRWKVQQTGTAVNVSQQTFTVGQTDVPNNPMYFARCVTTSSAGANNFCVFTQFIESVYSLANKTITISFWAKADASRNIAIEIAQIFASSPLTSIPVGIAALTTSWKQFTFTIAIPSIAGKTIGTSGLDALAFYFWLDAGSNFAARASNVGQQSGTFDFAQVQIEEGAYATAFDKRPVSLETVLCYRYCYVMNLLGGNAFSSGAQYSSTGALATICTPVPLRAQPTMTIAGAGLGWTGDGTGNTSNPTLANIGSLNQFTLVFTISGATVGRAGYAYAKTGNASIILDAEL